MSSQDSKPSNKVKKDKKKKQHKHKRDSTNPAIGINITRVGDKKKRKKDLSKIICFNCKKKRHYAIKCQKSQKSKN